ncbi:hypothetical protein Tco_1307452 [Tanacetum coccineum]
MSPANQKVTTEYQEAIQATEDLESPAVGFVKTTEYKGGLAIQVNDVIKQNNTLLYLAIKQSHKLIELEEKLNKLQQEVHTVIEQEPTNLENSISSQAKQFDNFSISGIKEMTCKRPNILNKSSTQVELPTKEDQIHVIEQLLDANIKQLEQLEEYLEDTITIYPRISCRPRKTARIIKRKASKSCPSRSTLFKQ